MYLVLGIAVQCDRRETYIEGISELDFETQKKLKEIIESVISGEIYRCYLQTDLPMPQLPLLTAPVQPESAPTDNDLDESSEHQLREDVKTLIAEREKQDRVYQAEISGKLEQLCVAEREILRLQADIGSLTRSLESAQTQIRNQAVEVYNLERSHEHALSVAAEELDCLRARAQEADRLENKVEALRQRLEMMMDAKECLLAEVAAHKELQSRLLLVEKELSMLRPLKPMVEEYRVQLSEMSVALAASNEDYNRMSEQCDALVAANQTLSSAKMSLEEEFHHLRDELFQRNTVAVTDYESLSSHEDGAFDRSPALLLEIERLKAENDELNARVDQSTAAAVDALNKKLEDQLCSNHVLQTKWFSKKVDLENKDVEIARLTKQISELEKVNQSLLQHVDELTEAHLEETRTLNLKWGAEKESLIAKYNVLENEHAALEQLLVEARNEIEKKSSEKSAVEALLTSISEEAEFLRGEVIEINDRHIEELKVKDRELASALSKFQEELVQNQLAIDEKLAASAEASKKKLLELSSELDDEKLKRRKIEREKKYFEQELHRFKNQAQTSGSGAIEVETAVSELKRMQSELDSANAELKQLRDFVEEERGESTITTRSKSKTNTGTGKSAVNDLQDMRVDQLVRERRELIAKSLEENREKMQLAQKLLAAEKEITTLKGKVTKLTLANERHERKLNACENPDDRCNDENIRNV